MRIYGFVLAVVFCAVGVSCTSEKEPGTPEGGGVKAPSQPAASPVAGVAKEDADGLLKTAAKTAEESKGAAAEQAESGQATTADLAKAADDDFSLEQLKALAKGLPVEKLEGIATKLSEAIQGHLKTIEDLKGKIAGLSATDLLGDSVKNLKESLDQAMTSLGPLREKLGVIANMLKEKGIDISKYTSLLEGK